MFDAYYLYLGVVEGRPEQAAYCWAGAFILFELGCLVPTVWLGARWALEVGNVNVNELITGQIAA